MRWRKAIGFSSKIDTSFSLRCRITSKAVVKGDQVSRKSVRFSFLGSLEMEGTGSFPSK